jgi:hypothetical protein
MTSPSSEDNQGHPSTSYENIPMSDFNQAQNQAPPDYLPQYKFTPSLHPEVLTREDEILALSTLTQNTLAADDKLYTFVKLQKNCNLVLTGAFYAIFPLLPLLAVLVECKDKRAMGYIMTGTLSATFLLSCLFLGLYAGLGDSFCSTDTTEISEESDRTILGRLGPLETSCATADAFMFIGITETFLFIIYAVVQLKIVMKINGVKSAASRRREVGLWGMGMGGINH